MKIKKILHCAIVVTLVTAIAIAYFLLRPISPREIFNNSLESIVELRASTSLLGESYGTAEFIDAEGTLVTNAHVVTYKQGEEVYLFEEYSIRFASETEYRKVELIKYDIDKDIAILKTIDRDVSFKAIKIGNSNEVYFGDKVYAIGNISNYGLAITQGIVSIPKLNVAYEEITREVIQCDLTISSGNSGGALLDERGRLIGLTTFRAKDSNGDIVYGLAYCIPIHIVMEYVNS